MLIKWIHFAVLIHIISAIAAKHFKDVDFEDLSESVEEKKTAPCVGGTCHSAKKEKEPSQTESQPNVFDLLKLITQLANNSNHGETNISINVRDIQSGFQNGGSKYHVGNIHRELTREKRDTESVMNEDLTNEGTSNGDVHDVEEDSGKELTTTENPYNNNGAVDSNVRSAEENNFQDSNATNIYDSVANGTATASLLSGNIVSNYSNSLGLQVNDYLDAISDTLSNFNETNDNDATFNNTVAKFNGPDDQNVSLVSSVNVSQVPNSEVEIPLSRRALINIENILSDDLGVKSKGAIPVANFTVNVDTGKDNPVVVIVYNCSCGSSSINHTHANSTVTKVGNYENNHGNDTKLSNTRRNLSNYDKIITSSPTEVESEKILPDNEDKSISEVHNEKSNADLENLWLQKCNSLLSLQLKNKNNVVLEEVSESTKGNISLHEEKVEVFKQPLSVSENDENSTDTDDANLGNSENDSRVVQTGANINFNTQIKNNAENGDKITFHTDVVDKTFSLPNNVNAAVITPGTNLPINNPVLDGTVNRRRKRRSVFDVSNDSNTLNEGPTISRRNFITEMYSKIFNHLMIVPSDSAENNSTETNSVDTKTDLPNTDNDAVLTKNITKEYKNENVKKPYTNKTETDEVDVGHGKPIKTNETIDDNQRHRRSMQNVMNYVRKHYVISPNDYFGSRRTKRDVNVLRNPIYYEYANDKPSLLDADPNSKEYGGVIVHFKSVVDANRINNSRIVSSSDQNKNDIKTKDKLSSLNNDKTLDDFKDLLSILSFKPVAINVYLQLLMKQHHL